MRARGDRLAPLAESADAVRRVVPEIARTDPVAPRFGAHRERRVLAQCLRGLERAERGVGTVAILGHAGTSDVEEEVIAVRAVRRIGKQLPPRARRKPMVRRQQRLIRPLMRGRVAVEAIGTEVLLEVGHRYAAPFADRRARVEAGRLEPALVHEAVGAIRGHGDALSHRTASRLHLPGAGHQSKAAGLQR